mgnify:CR=1 FL=1
MKKFFSNQIVRFLILTSVLVFGTLSIVAPVSCRLTEEGLEIIPADTTAPSIETFFVSGEKSILISCSEQIVLDGISVFEIADETDEIPIEFIDGDSSAAYAVASSVSYSEDQKSVQIELSEGTKVGKNYVFSGKIYDITGNSLNFCQKFCGYNENPARLIFNELRTVCNRDSDYTEFIEFYVLKGGNTFGLEIVSGANSEAKKYVFPSLEVQQGDYIVVHGRTVFAATKTAEEKTVANFADELDDDLTLSATTESCDTARDLWKTGSDKLVSANDVVVLRDSSTGTLKDAVFLSASGKTAWSKNLMKEFSEKAFNSGIWITGSTPECAIITDYATTLYRSVSRQNTLELAKKYENPNALPDYIQTSAADWILTEKYKSGKETISGATPGTENSINEYVKK